MPLENLSLGKVFPNFPNLVNYPINKTVAWTVSLPRRYEVCMCRIRPKPLTKKRRKWMFWYEMEPEAQWNFLKYIYLPQIFKYCRITKCYVTGELNTSKDVHAHAIIYSDDVEWDVATYISKCSHYVVSLDIHHHKNEKRLNCIHAVKSKIEIGKDMDWYEYILKEKNKMIPYTIGENVKPTVFQTEACDGSPNDENATDTKRSGSNKKAKKGGEQSHHKSCREETRSLLN